MQYLYEKVSSTYNWLADYYYGREQKPQDYSNLSKQDKILALRKLLKQKCPFSEQVSGKIQMQFTKLIQTYQHSTFTTLKPIQHPILPNESLTQTITLTVALLFQTDKIKCPLTLHCHIQSTFPQTHPKIYVNYPLLNTKSQTGEIFSITSIPNPLFVQITQKQKNTQCYNYKAKTGGIQVIFKEPSNKKSIKQLIDESIQKMKREFPFLKSKNTDKVINQQTNQDQQTQKIYQLTQNLKQCLIELNKIDCSQNQQKQQQKQQQQQSKRQQQKQQSKSQQQGRYELVEILRRSQQLDILLRSINSEIQGQKEENKKVLEVLKSMEEECNKIERKNNFSQYYPVVKENDTHSKEMFQLLVEHQATKDCLIEIQSILKHPTQSNNKILTKEQLNSFLNLSQQFNQKLFWQRLKINQLIQQQKHKHPTS